MRLSLATRRWLARITAPRRRKPTGKKRHAAAAHKLKAPRLALLGTRGKLRIYLVATTPTKRIYVDWTEGGHDVVYNFIPKNEVWISDNLPPLENLLTQIHELRERRRMIELMRGGMKQADAYDKAHDESLSVEDKYRKANGRGLKAALQRERGA
jgi:hypothetical protein